MKYLQLKQKHHMGKPLHVIFQSVEPKIVSGNFGNENHLTGTLASPGAYHTAPTKDGTKYKIEKGDEFTFVVSDALLREIQGAYVDSSKALSLEMYTNETGYTKYMVNIAGESIDNMTYADKDEVPFGASEMNDATLGSSDAKWDAINRKKRLEIAHGQAFNIGAMTVNGADPKIYEKDPDRWANAVAKVAGMIYPYLVLEPEEPSVYKKEEKPKDDLPF